MPQKKRRKVPFLISGSSIHAAAVRKALEKIPQDKRSNHICQLAQIAMKQGFRTISEASYTHNTKENIIQVYCPPELKAQIDEFCDRNFGKYKRSRWLIAVLLNDKFAQTLAREQAKVEPVTTSFVVSAPKSLIPALRAKISKMRPEQRNAYILDLAAKAMRYKDRTLSQAKGSFGTWLCKIDCTENQWADIQAFVGSKRSRWLVHLIMEDSK